MKKLIIMLISSISIFSVSAQDTPLRQQKVTTERMEKEDQKKKDEKQKHKEFSQITQDGKKHAVKYTDQYIKDANIVAESWLSNINDKQYESAYRLLTSETKANYIKEEWISFLRELMLEFGKFQERKIKSSIFQGSIEGLDDGFYVIIEYNSNYKNTINHEEYILVKQNDKLKWEIESFNYKFMKLDGSK